MADYDTWDDQTVGDTARLKRMTNVPNTGTYLAALSKTEHGLFICTADGGGLVADHLYMCNAIGDALIDITATQEHFHSGSTDGGELLGLFQANNRFTILQLSKTNDMQKANWIQTVTGTGSIEDKTDGTTGERSIRLRPNGTISSGATISYPHLRCAMGLSSSYECKLQIETATSLALHTGVGADDITAADTNTVKYNAEICTATNSNWFLRTADGSANSSSDSGIAMTANRVGVNIQHYPQLGTPETDLWIVDEAVFQKTTNIPITGNTDDNNIVKHSIKNNTGADRPLLVYATRLTYYISGTEAWVTF